MLRAASVSENQIQQRNPHLIAGTARETLKKFCWDSAMEPIALATFHWGINVGKRRYVAPKTKRPPTIKIALLCNKNFDILPHGCVSRVACKYEDSHGEQRVCTISRFHDCTMQFGRQKGPRQ